MAAKQRGDIVSVRAELDALEDVGYRLARRPAAALRLRVSARPAHEADG